jgi:hypothetical protein
MCGIHSIWNFASAHSLVIVTANVPPGPGQRVDIEIIDGSERGNVYLSKRVSEGLCAGDFHLPYDPAA